MTKLGPLESGHETQMLITFAQSPVGKKILTGLTGLGLVTFVLIHMLGNWLLLAGRDPFNQYAYTLESLKPLLLSIEFILLLLVTIHAVLGIQIYLNRRQARPDKYDSLQSVGDPSHQTWSSRNMIWTGVTLALFLVWHLATFKFGTTYTTQLHGEQVRDLAQLVIETFQNPIFTVSYGVLLAVLLLHLRHGLWSAWQSVGVLSPNRHPSLYLWCNGFAWFFFLGFMVPPIAILGGMIT